MHTLSSRKEQARARNCEDVAAFLARGGSITHVARSKRGISGRAMKAAVHGDPLPEEQA